VVSTPPKNISQLGWLFPIYGKIKNVPNHQPVIYFHRIFHEINHPKPAWGSPAWKAPFFLDTKNSNAVRHPTWILLRFLEGLKHGLLSKLAVDTNFYSDQE